MTKLHRLTTQIRPDQYKYLKESTIEGLSISHIVRVALDNWITLREAVDTERYDKWKEMLMENIETDLRVRKQAVSVNANDKNHHS